MIKIDGKTYALIRTEQVLSCEACDLASVCKPEELMGEIVKAEENAGEDCITTRSAYKEVKFYN